MGDTVFEIEIIESLSDQDSYVQWVPKVSVRPRGLIIIIKPLGRLRDLELAHRKVNSSIFKLEIDIVC